MDAPGKNIEGRIPPDRTPTVYYAYDANFLGFLSVWPATQANVDEAFAIINFVFRNVDSIPYPELDGVAHHGQGCQLHGKRARIDGFEVRSLRSEMMSGTNGIDIAPERYTWTFA